MPGVRAGAWRPGRIPGAALALRWLLLALTRNVVETVVTESEKAGATRVKTVYLVIGYARDIIDDLFEGCFEFLSRGTVAHGAELVIERIPLTVRCNGCGMVYHIDVRNEETWPCPRCKERDYRVNSGMEFYISRIEVE